MFQFMTVVIILCLFIIQILCTNFLPKSDLMYIVLVLYNTYNMYLRMCVFVFIHMYICTL